MVIWLMLVIQSLISFLSSRECYLPTIIRQGNRSIVGVSPSGIHPGGFHSFMSETVRFHHRRVIHLNNNVSKLCKSVQTHIWDPGVPIIRYEHGGKELRLNRFNKSCVTLFSVRFSDEGGQFPKTPTIIVHGGAILFLNSLGYGGALPKVSTISSDGEALFGLEDEETKLRRFVSDAFAHYRWNFRLSNSECPLTQWYGDVTWVFDPKINEGINLFDGTRIRYQIGSEAFLLPERVHRYIQLTSLWYNPKQVTSMMRKKMVKSDGDGDVFSFP